MTEPGHQLPPPLWNWMIEARWFAGKGRQPRLGSVHPLPWFVHTDELAVRAELVEVHLGDGSRELYQLVLVYRREASQEAQPICTLESARAPLGPAGEPLPCVGDALVDPAALRALVDVLGAGPISSPLPGQEDDWSATIVRPADLSGRLTLFGGEQSNTSVLVGEVALVKFFRRLEAGANLDIAVHDALGRSGVDAVATLYGWVSASLGGGPGGTSQSFDLAMIVQQLPQARDGWELATRAAARDDDFTADAAALGRALAEVHRALRDTFPTTMLAGAAISSAMRERLARAADEVPALGGLVEALDARFALIADSPVPGQRIHGDFHLGQTLHTAEGWRIIDFEGEPIKALSERSEPDSPWRDVAGMLRSFAYATASADDPAGVAARDWLDRTTQAFLEAYRHAAPHGTMTSGTPALLDAYVADKAVYEVVYETRNRPEWVEIPLGALRVLTH